MLTDICMYASDDAQMQQVKGKPALLSLHVCILEFIRANYEGKVKSSQSSLCETQDKWLLGRDPDKGWCHRHTSILIELFWSLPIAP